VSWEIAMTDNEREILEVLQTRLRKENQSPDISRWMRPTEIGLYCYCGYNNAASWACRYLKRLKDRGLVRREPPGVYSITLAGIAALKGRPS
jgi:hypothetical protein